MKTLIRTNSKVLCNLGIEWRMTVVCSCLKVTHPFPSVSVNNFGHNIEAFYEAVFYVQLVFYFGLKMMNVRMKNNKTLLQTIAWSVLCFGRYLFLQINKIKHILGLSLIFIGGSFVST